MTYQAHIHRLQYLDQLIRQRATGSSSSLASRLNVCRTTVTNDLDCLRQLGGDIGYCRVRRTYYYRDSRRLFIGFVPEFSVTTLARWGGQVSSPKFFLLFYYRPELPDSQPVPCHRFNYSPKPLIS